MATVLKNSRSARIHRELDHPVIDGDGHWFEPMPILAEFLFEQGGQKAMDAYVNAGQERADRWYSATSEERIRQQIVRPGWWNRPGNTIDLATSMIPSLMYERLDDFGIDFTLIYPTRGLVASRIQDPELRSHVIRAVNTMSMEMFKPYADRMTPVGMVPMNTPEEAIAEAEYAVETLGMKAVVIDNYVKRTELSGGAKGDYIDPLATDSIYDYDPVWAKLVELKVAATTHGPSAGWADRRCPSSYVANHLGHFAQAHHLFSRSLFLGGVTQRFPTLQFAFLEGGAGWAASLCADLVNHWQKRSRAAMERDLKPTNIDRKELRSLFQRYAGERFEGKVDQIIERNLALGRPMTLEELAERDRDSNDFPYVDFNSADEIREQFSRAFYFGCQSDDPTTGWAFDSRLQPNLKALFSSDISHFDVTDMTEVLEEAYELVERGLMNRQDFKRFAFTNSVTLHARTNPDFFRGTVVESAAARELQVENG